MSKKRESTKQRNAASETAGSSKKRQHVREIQFPRPRNDQTEYLSKILKSEDSFEPNKLVGGPTITRPADAK